MVRPLARFALLLPTLMTALLLLIHVPRYDAAPITRFFDDCAIPCWQGIRPGVTGINSALAILHAHPWVDGVSQVNPVPFEGNTTTVLVYWTWSRDYPYATALAYSEQGILITERGVVRQIYLTTSIPFGDLWLALGGADGGLVTSLYDAGSIRIDSTAHYAGAGVTASGMVYANCAVAYPDLWRAPVYLWLRDNAADAANDEAFAAYTRPGFTRIRAALC